MEALVGRNPFPQSLHFFEFFFLYGGLSFEKLADSGSPRFVLCSSRPHSPPVGDPNRTIWCAEACQGWTFFSRCPLATSVTSTSAPACLRFAGLTTDANLPYVHCPSAEIPPASKNTMTAGSGVLCSDLRPPRQARSLWPCSGRTQQSEHQSLPLYPSRLVGIQLAMRVVRRW